MKHNTTGPHAAFVGARLSGPTPAPAVKAGKFWNIAASSDDADEGIITLYGDVMSQTPIDWWTGEPEPGLFTGSSRCTRRPAAPARCSTATATQETTPR